jgi:ABC-type polysaccharide/polyol phosphate export permease
MNDFTGMDWGFFFYTLGSLIYGLLPVILILTGIGLIFSSINHEPRGLIVFTPGIIGGIVFILFGIIWGLYR